MATQAAGVSEHAVKSGIITWDPFGDIQASSKCCWWFWAKLFFQQNPEKWVGPVSYNNPLEDGSCAGIVRSPLAAGTDLKKSEAFGIAAFSSWVLEIQICFESTGQQQQDRSEGTYLEVKAPSGSAWQKDGQMVKMQPFITLINHDFTDLVQDESLETLFANPTLDNFHGMPDL